MKACGRCYKGLKDAVEAEGLECDIDEGGGAFYGPKIDIKIKDALNRDGNAQLFSLTLMSLSALI